MEKMLLVKFDCNYADEFDTEGFIVMSESEWLKHITHVEKHFENWNKTHEPDRWGNRQGIEVYFGTNEAIIYEAFDSYRSSFSTSELSDSDYDTLKRLFGKSYGPIRNGMVVMIDPEDPDLEDEDVTKND
jgi:hypothetical protein